MAAKVRPELADDQDERDGSRRRLRLEASDERDRDELMEVAMMDELALDRCEGLPIAVRIQMMIGMSLLLWLAVAYGAWSVTG